MMIHPPRRAKYWLVEVLLELTSQLCIDNKADSNTIPLESSLTQGYH